MAHWHFQISTVNGPKEILIGTNNNRTCKKTNIINDIFEISTNNDAKVGVELVFFFCILNKFNFYTIQ